MKSTKKIIIFQISLFVVLLLADLLSKHFVMRFLNQQTFGYFVVIKKVLAFKYSLNEGASFGIFAGKQVFLITFTSIALLLIIGLLVFLNINKDVQKKGGLLLSVSIVLILAGGIGNLVDRIAFEHVRDFIEYTFVETLFNRRFAICNVADIELTIGVVLLIVYVLFFYQTKKPNQKVEIKKEPSSNDDQNIKEALDLYECKYNSNDKSSVSENRDDSLIFSNHNNDPKDKYDGQEKEG